MGNVFSIQESEIPEQSSVQSNVTDTQNVVGSFAKRIKQNFSVYENINVHDHDESRE